MEPQQNPEPSPDILPDLYLTEESIAIASLVDEMTLRTMTWIKPGQE